MGQKLLLVEDDRGIATMLKAALPMWGFDVLYAEDARTALEIARVQGADIRVVLCDVMLPDVPGPSIAAAIRDFCPGVWIIFTSGYPVDVLDERGLLLRDTLREAGTGYLAKPFLPRDVRDLVGCALLTSYTQVKRGAYAAIAY
jgi:DNA-binding response OmpR family regulator